MKKILFVFALSFIALTTFAQKVGHVNTGILLEAMPEVKAADSQMEAYQKQLMTKGESMVKTFQAEYQAIVADVNAGKLTPQQQQVKQEELQKKQQAIQTYEQQVQSDMMKKREELLKPILTKVDKAIQDVGKEQGFLFIFDTSVPNVILFADEPLDMTNEVKAKLGM